MIMDHRTRLTVLLGRDSLLFLREMYCEILGIM